MIKFKSKEAGIKLEAYCVGFISWKGSISMKEWIAAVALTMFLAGCSNETNLHKSNFENKESDSDTVDGTIGNSSESLTNSQEEQKNDGNKSSSRLEWAGQDQKDSKKELEGNSDDKNVNKEKYIEKLNAIETEAIEIRNNDDDTTLGMIKSEEKILSKWDQALNEIYQVLEKQLSKNEMEKLRVEQRKWIEYKDRTAKEAAKNYEGGTMNSLEYIASKAGTTKERTYELVESYMK